MNLIVSPGWCPCSAVAGFVEALGGFKVREFARKDYGQCVASIAVHLELQNPAKPYRDRCRFDAAFKDIQLHVVLGCDVAERTGTEVFREILSSVSLSMAKGFKRKRIAEFDHERFIEDFTVFVERRLTELEERRK